MAIGTTAAIIGASVIGAGASMYGASQNANATRDNANANRQLTEAQIAANNAAIQQGWIHSDTATHTAASNIAQNVAQYQAQGEGLFRSWIDRGNAAGNQINALLGLSGSAAAEKALQTWADSGGQQFILKGGSDAISGQRAMRGALQSGGTLKALTKYGQQVGSQYLGQYMSALGGQQATGLSAANSLSNVNSNALSQLASANTNWANQLNNTASNMTGLGVNQTTGATTSLINNNNNATNALINNTNQMTNAIGGFAGNALGAYGMSQGWGSSNQGGSMPQQWNI